MAASMVRCLICRNEWAEALCKKIRGPNNQLDYMCNKCFDKLSPKIQKEIRVT